jgi:hypothetical protein
MPNKRQLLIDIKILRNALRRTDLIVRGLAQTYGVEHVLTVTSFGSTNYVDPYFVLNTLEERAENDNDTQPH